MVKFATLWVLAVLWVIVAKAITDYWLDLGHYPFGSSLLIGSFHISALIALGWLILKIYKET